MRLWKNHPLVLAARAKEAAKPKKPKPADGMNNLERRYAEEVLKVRQQAGEISCWSFEAVKLRLANRTWYTPDFCVVMPSGEVQFHETKGRWMDDARVKIKVAAETHPHLFVAIRRIKHEWVYEYFLGRRFRS